MLRGILAVLLIGVGLFVAPPAGGDPQQTCPPTCDRIPDTAWPGSSLLPLDSTYHWPNLAGVAGPATAAKFRFEELCAGPRPFGDPRDYAVKARAVVTEPDGQWQLQAQILHWRGETWRGGELAMSVLNSAAVALRICPVTAPQFATSITTDAPGRLAAVLDGPQILHQYLVADPRNSTVTELALWVAPAATGAEVPWPGISDAKVLDAMAAPLCGAYLGSCG